MPEFEVEVSYTIRYSGIVHIRAKDEDTAEQRVTEKLEKVMSKEGFEKVINAGEIDVEESVDIDSINEV